MIDDKRRIRFVYGDEFKRAIQTLLAVVVLTTGSLLEAVVVNAPRPNLDPILDARSAPLDFQFYAMSRPGARAAIDPLKDAIQELNIKKVRIESIGPNFSAADHFWRPSLYAGSAGLDPKEFVPRFWAATFNQHRASVLEATNSVCRIEVSYFRSLNGGSRAAASTIVGTGFMAAEGIVMTNRHVAELFAEPSPPPGTGYVFKADTSQTPPAVVTVDFAGVYGEMPRLFFVDKVVFMSDRGQPDVALLELRPGSKFPPPTRLESGVWPSTAGEQLFVCGYPVYPHPDDAPIVTAQFRMLRVKRLSLGHLAGVAKAEIDDEGSREILFHNCFTLYGSSGSPVFNLERGTVVALHFSGWNELGCMADPIGQILKLAPVGVILAQHQSHPIPDPGAGRVDSGVNKGVTPSPSDSQKDNRKADEQIPKPVDDAKHGSSVLRSTHGKLVEAQKLPQEWARYESDLNAAVQRNLPYVGLVISDKKPMGVAFAIRPGVVLTASDVAKAIPINGAGKPIFRRITVSFADTPLRDAGKESWDVDEIVVPEKYAAGLSLLICRKPNLLQEGPPLELEEKGSEGLSFLVGYPFQSTADSTDPLAFLASFPPPYGDKRVSLGRVLEPIRVKDPEFSQYRCLAHTCSTTRGYAGAPVVSLKTGKVIGVHLGSDGRQNFMVSVEDILTDPKFVSAIKRASDR